MRINLFPVLSILLVFVAGSYFGDVSRASVILLIFLTIYLISRITKEFTITYLIAGLAALQWLVAPTLYFSDLNPGMVFEISKMKVSESEYFQFAFPSTIAYCIGLVFFRVKDGRLSETLSRIRQKLPELSKKAQALVLIGFLTDILTPYSPLAIRQYLLFIGYFKFMGVAILILNYVEKKDRTSLRYILLSMLLIVVGTLKSLMFGELVFAMILIAVVIYPFTKSRLLRRLVAFALLSTMVLAIQLAKPIARNYMWQTKGNPTFSGLVKTLKENRIFSMENVKSEAFMGYTIARFNQGSVISWVMHRVPRRMPYEHGKTVAGATVGAFVPRILWPGKPKVGKAMYQKYTGLKLKKTSYGISQLGEAYVNFGPKGSVPFMFFLGVLFNLIQNLLVMRSFKSLAIIFILPIIFIHGIKVETDITRSLGFIIRYLVFLSVLNFGMKNMFGKKVY